MKLVTKPHLLKVSVLFYLALNKGESSNPKKTTQTKKPKNPAFTKPGHCIYYFSLALPEPLQVFLIDAVKIPRCKKLVGLTEGVLTSPK